MKNFNRIFLKTSVLLLALVIAFSCFCSCKTENNGESEKADSGDQSSGKSKLYVFNWGDYIADETIEKFEAKYPNIEVVYDIFDSNESMYQKLVGSNIAYDVIIPSDYMIERLIRENRLQKIDMTKLTNYHYIDEKCLNTIYDPTNSYSVPYTFGTLGILYNTSLVEEEITSWDTLWDDNNAGEILMLDQIKDTFCAALKKLGYSCNTTNPDEIEAARQILVDQKKLVATYGNDDLKDKMIAGKYKFSLAYSGDAIWMMDENEDLNYVVPEEGSNFFIDAICIPTTSRNTEAAYLFIDFLNEPDIAYENAEYIGYSTPHTAAMELMCEEYKDNENMLNCYNPSAETLSKCEQYISFDTDTQKIYNDAWRTVRQFSGLSTPIIITLIVVAVAIIAFIVFEIIKKKKRSRA